MARLSTSPARLALVSDPPASARPPQLDDPEWLRRRLEQDGAMAIALDLGVTRWAVRAACERFGIASSPPGRRRVTSGKPPDPHPMASRLVHRYARDQQEEIPATKHHLLKRYRDLEEAEKAGDDEAYIDAALGIGALGGLLADHRDKLRRAA